MIDWPSYNRSLVRRGEILFSYDFLDIWDSDLDLMNKNKKGKSSFVFPNSFILVIGYIRYFLHLPYRQTEGIINSTGKSLPVNPPSYGHICKRINKLNVNINDHDRKGDDDYIIIATDSTGIKVTNKGQWMDEKWNVQRKGYLKIHVAVNIKTKEIFALEETKEKVHDGKILPKMVNHVFYKSDTKIESYLPWIL